MILPDRTVPALLCFLALAGLSGCRRTEAEYQKLVEENEYLKGEISRLNRRGAEEKKDATDGGASVAEPDLKLTIVDLWSQRFDDNEFRARQRLSNKTIRLTGSVDGVAADAIGMAGASKRFGNINMRINLVGSYALRISQGLAALERGTIVTVQGKFLYERMTLSEGIFVDQATGRTLYSDDLFVLPSGVPVAARPATPAPKTTPPPAPVVTPAPK